MVDADAVPLELFAVDGRGLTTVRTFDDTGSALFVEATRPAYRGTVASIRASAPGSSQFFLFEVVILVSCFFASSALISHSFFFA